MTGLGPLWVGCRAEILQLRRSPLLVVLVVVQAVTFLLLVSLFGVTGSRAPTALVDEDETALSRHFAADLEAAHHSFALRPMPAAAARAALERGDLVAMITLRSGFGAAIERGETIGVPVDVDNVDVDLTADVQRAVPSAIVAFARELNLPGVRVHAEERDLVDHETGFIPYLIVSALGLDALVVAGTLGASAVAREFETGAAAVLATTPAGVLLPLLGRVIATAAVALGGIAVTAAIVVAGYGVRPVHPAELVLALVGCVAVSACLGAALGAVAARTITVAALVFGLALPLYIDSGSLEPERFDGETIWWLAHASPMYQAIGLLEDAAHGLRVTPEPVGIDAALLGAWGVLAIGVAAFAVQRRSRRL